MGRGIGRGGAGGQLGGCIGGIEENEAPVFQINPAPRADSNIPTFVLSFLIILQRLIFSVLFWPFHQDSVPLILHLDHHASDVVEDFHLHFLCLLILILEVPWPVELPNILKQFLYFIVIKVELFKY